MVKSWSLAVFVAAAMSSAAAAQSVDRGGALDMSRSLSRYVGSTAFERGVLKITPDGDAYLLELNLMALAALLPTQAQEKFEFKPYALRARPRPDGAWDIEGDLIPSGWIEIPTPFGPQRTEWQALSGKIAGIFDPELAAFSNATGSFDQFAMRTEDHKQSADVRFGAGRFTMEARKAAGGGVDLSASQTISDFAEVVSVDSGGGPNFDVKLTVPALATDLQGSGLRTRAVLDLVAFAVANPEEEQFKARQAEFKELLRAALPLWDWLNGGYRLTGLTAESPMGTFRAAKVDFEIEMDGISDNGSATYRMGVSGLQLPELGLPNWLVSLLPTDAAVGVSGVGIDLNGPARLLIDNLDVAANPPVPDEIGQRIEADFMANPPRLILSKSAVRNQDTEITAEGEMSFAGGEPDLHATVEASGYDKALKTIQAAMMADPSDRDLAQILPVALVAKGLAKALPDGRLQWVVEVKSDGSVTINGAMLKGPDPR